MTITPATRAVRVSVVDPLARHALACVIGGGGRKGEGGKEGEEREKRIARVDYQ